jgi:ABC-type lipoprotein export system ATPase subunit
MFFDESNQGDAGARVVNFFLREYSNKITVFVTHDPQIAGMVDVGIDSAEINRNPN